MKPHERCGHSACSQHYIDTGRSTCVHEFVGTNGIAPLRMVDGSSFGELHRAQPTRTNCESHVRGKGCIARVRFWWIREGKRDIGFCEQHARDAFGEAFAPLGARPTEG